MFICSELIRPLENIPSSTSRPNRRIADSLSCCYSKSKQHV